jgi:hypothetical protein
VIDDRDIWATALALVERYGDAAAMLEAATRADQLLEDGNPVAAANWHRILDCIERIQVQKPAEGEKVH